MPVWSAAKLPVCGSCDMTLVHFMGDLVVSE